MNTRCTLALLPALVLSSSVALTQVPCTQTLPRGFDSTRGNNSSLFPFAVTTPHKWQWVYDSGQFDHQGPLSISQIFVRVFDNLASHPGASFGLTLRLGASPNNYTVGTPPNGQDPIFANNILSPVTVMSGTFTTGPTTSQGAANPSQWVPFGLTSPFTYDPSTGMDLVVELDKCSATAPWLSLDASTGAMGSNGGNFYGNTFSCTATSSTSMGNENVPIIRVDYTPNSPMWQINQSGADLQVDFQQGTPCLPLDVNKCINQGGIMSLASTSTTGWELGVQLVPGVPAGGGGFVTANGQVLNLDVAAPSLTLINNFAFPPFAPFAFGYSIPTPLDFWIQLMVLDGANVDGYSLSGLAGIHVTTAMTLPGPTTDDSTLHVVSLPPPLCGPFSIPFYGTNYTDFWVNSNGRVSFNAGHATPAAGTAVGLRTNNPSVGLWNDLDPAVGGTITISAPTSNVVRVDWVNVPYFGQTVTNTFGIQFDAATGWITIDGLATTVANPGNLNSILGISLGNLGATDNGPTPFTLGGPNAPMNPTSMLYEFGPIGTIAAGLTSVTFIPSATQAPNYDWVGF